MTLTVVNPGLQSTIQAAPFEARHIGLPGAGPADVLAMAVANACVGNGAWDAAIEITLTTASFRAEQDHRIAVAGAPGSLRIDGEDIAAQQAITLPAGATLDIGPATGGCRRYLAIAGGIATPTLLGSRSTYLPAGLGGLAGRALQAGDEISVGQSQPREPITDIPPLPHYGDAYILRVTAGPEEHWFDAASFQSLGEIGFTVGRRANRVGLQLTGAELAPTSNQNLKSSAVFPGTIQCPPDGQPFLLGVDAQTTGGYPRIAQVIRADRHLIGQLKSGDTVRFVPVSNEQAQAIYREKMALWRASIADLQLG